MDFLYSELNSINVLTIVCFFDFLFKFNQVAWIDTNSATFLLIKINILSYIILKNNPSLERKHFTSSRDNFERKRYWVLLTSSFAHADINHLLCNLFVFYLDGSWFESILGYRNMLIFVCLSSIASSFFSLKIHGNPSIGFSGVLYAINGFVIRFIDWKLKGEFIVDGIIFFFATNHKNIDHAGHIGGFLFGYFVPIRVLTYYS